MIATQQAFVVGVSMMAMAVLSMPIHMYIACKFFTVDHILSYVHCRLCDLCFMSQGLSMSQILPEWQVQ